MAELLGLKKQRATNKGKLTNILKFIKEASDKTSLEEFRTRLMRVEKLMEEFTTIENRIFFLDESEAPDSIYEENYYQAITGLNTLIRTRTLVKSDNGNSAFDSSFNATQPGAHSEVKLPKINIPPFTGEYTEWQSFYDLFTSTIHESTSLSPVQKFQYLKGLLRGEAAVLLRHISVTESNYIGALNKLKERYNRKRHIINSFIQTFMEQPQINTASANNIKKLMDTSDEVLRGLKAIGENAETRDPWLVFILVNKLDDKSKALWAEMANDLDNPVLSDFMDFLSRRLNTLELLSMSVKKSQAKPGVKSHVVTKVNNNKCVMCDEEHSLFQCSKFNELDVIKRKEWVKSKIRCFNCLSSGHTVFKCSSRRRCQQCGKKHHTLLHQTDTKDDKTAKALEVISHCAKLTSFHSVLPTALIKVVNAFGQEILCRALLDSGSQVSFITELCTKRLQLKRSKSSISVSGLSNSKAGLTKGLVTFVIKTKLNSELTVNAFILNKITTQIPSQELTDFDSNCWKDVELADPYFNKPNQIDILLGADLFFNLLQNGQIKSSKNELILQNTVLGWIVSGRSSITKNEEIISMMATANENPQMVDIDKTLRQFWELEAIQQDKINLSPEEKLCEDQFCKEVTRNNEGRFVVKLPFKNSPDEIGKSMAIAIQRLRGMERRFVRDPEFFDLYKKFMFEYQNLNHMEEIPQHEINHHGYYLPHHGVLKPSSTTTKLRVVFDGSAKTTSGKSLNDCLAVGPTVQPTLYAILLRFRKHRISIVADIEKMYRQVLVSPSDMEYQKIVWRTDPSQPIKHFRLRTVTYGLASASFLATRCLKEIAENNRSDSPSLSNVISNSIYVDDLMAGAETESEALHLKQTIKSLLKENGFNLQKWMSNSTAMLESNINGEQVASVKEINLNMEEKTSLKVLGLTWQPETDKFVFTCELPEIQKLTKRIILSEASRLFDPLGWLAPIVILIKNFVQQLWAGNLDWDDLLPVPQANKWNQLRSELKHVNTISIPRFIQTTKYSTVEMHGFADASQDAYAAVVYFKIQSSDGVFIKLITAKTKVAPIKQVSLPRLELCAAVLLANLMSAVNREIHMPIIQIYAWTDSKIVLDWLASHPRRWSTFVGNRTAEILNSTSRKQWRHVPSSDNPADCASRGLLPSDLTSHTLWWNGPDWLHQSIEHWPSQTTNYGNIEEETHKLFAFTTTVDENKLMETLICKFSSFRKLSRVLSYILRYCKNLKKPTEHKIKGTYLYREELFYTLQKICQYEQQKYYQEDLQFLRAHKQIKATSQLKSLNPFLDEFGIIRVGGRLENSIASFSTKHPIILPSKSQITTLILEEMHLDNKHAGPSLLLAISRQTFWIPGGKSKARQIVNKCVVCAKFKAQTQQQLMGNLPSYRVQLARPFLKTGVDYAGPISLHLAKGRGQKTYKAYICLFICLSTKAIHLELVTDLTSDAFLGALKRFVARRGICQEIYSDNGTNFIGASNQLKKTFDTLIQSSNTIANYFSKNYITWHFNPPNAPHFGGIWEAGIKSMKYHLQRVIGTTILTLEEMNTLLAEIEGTLNSRPLCVLSSNDLDALTPSHFLIGHATTTIPEMDITPLKLSHLSRWQIVQQMSQHYWNRWNTEYLTSLQQRTKWKEQKKIH